MVLFFNLSACAVEQDQNEEDFNSNRINSNSFNNKEQNQIDNLEMSNPEQESPYSNDQMIEQELELEPQDNLFSKDDINVEEKRQENEGEATPQPEGGPEATTRDPRPVSNHILQQLYPEVMVLRGPRENNQIALTFDDGPDPRYTPKVLEVLRKHDVKATFFVMGARAKKHPDLIKQIANDGHALGSHTYWHPNLAKENVERLRWELSETDRILERMIGFHTRLFRAPYGNLNEPLMEELRRQDYSVIGWNVDSLDWRQLPADDVLKNVMSNLDPGSIVLMHDGGHWTMDLSGMVEALDQVIARMKEDHIEMVTIPELLGIRPYR
jgi:peptidoglycan/xylan/chitin deacetylase (PgdA/CDA1 family)